MEFERNGEISFFKGFLSKKINITIFLSIIRGNVSEGNKEKKKRKNLYNNYFFVWWGGDRITKTCILMSKLV